ncbi:MAG: HlyC/CorC family transporter [Alphaproteobacteria bacterium]
MSDPDLIFYGLTILLCLLLSAFFSGAETALTAVSRARIYQLMVSGNKRAERVSRLRKEKESLIGAILLGNNAVNIGASALATSLAINLLDSEHGVLMVTVIMTLVVVIFCEVLPKTYAIHHAEHMSLLVSPLVTPIVKILHPITLAVRLFIRLLFKLFGADITGRQNLISATDVIRGTIELHHREGGMIKHDRDMLGSILDLNEVEVEHIMIHRKHVEAINADLPTHDIIQHAVSSMHSRIPLWREEPDNLIGLLHVKNLIKLLNERAGKITNEDILRICHKPWFIPETTTLHSQLLAFRHKKQHFAFVVDEYGDWMGIVTLEDIIEEIVGEIDDEHDEAYEEIIKESDGRYMVDGDTTIRDINRHLDWNLPDEEAATVAGLLIHETGSIPDSGASYELHGIRFTVVGKDSTHITRLRMEKLAPASTQEDADV